MARTYKRVTGTGSGGVIIEGETLEIIPHWQPMKHDLDMLALSTFFRGQFMGGSRLSGLAVEADGDYDLPGWVPIPHDNTAAQLSGFTDANGATRIFQARYLIRVSNAAISATPKIRYGAAFGDIAVENTGTVATISGALACSATAEDFSGTNSYQTVTITEPSGVKLWKPQLTIAGTGGNPYTVYALAVLDSYIQS